MWIEKLKKTISTNSLIMFYSFIITIVMLAVLALTALGGFLLIHFGFIDETFYLNPLPGLVVVLVLSLLIGLVSRLFGMRILVKPLREMVKAMQELARGNFDVQMEVGKGLQPWELVDFYDNFNQTAKELQGIELLRTDFINNFSHQFKTPIVSIKGFAELLQQADLTDDKRQEYLDIIIAESNRLSTLAANVLTLSKIESQNIVARQTLFNLSEQLRDVILMMEPKWSAKELELDLELQEIDASDIHFHGNAELTQQIWVNLLDNAIKYSPHGGKLEIRLTDHYDKVIFEIQDHGCGMDAETQSEIFNKFFRADSSRLIEGSGLGMTIVQRILVLNQGQIELKSEPGQGTRVIISLPKQISLKNRKEQMQGIKR